MESQTSYISPLCSDQTYKCLGDPPDSWLNYVVNQEFTPLKSKDLNDLCQSEEQDKVENIDEIESQNFLASEVLDLSSKGFNYLEPSQELLAHDDWASKASFPSSERVVGMINFDIKFQEPKRLTKSISYTYSERLETLFVRQQNACDAVVCTRGDVPPNSRLYLTAMFLLPHHSKSPVRTCPNHVGTDEASSRHLIRVDLDGVHYGTHQGSDHHFVGLDFHGVAGGRDAFSIPLRFQCFSTCLGGIAKRPFQVIFSLECDKVVLGRKSIKTRVCSCPGRDRTTREREKFGSEESLGGSFQDYGKDNNENSKLQHAKAHRNKTYRMIKTQDHREFTIVMKVINHLREHSTTSCGCKEFFMTL